MKNNLLLEFQTDAQREWTWGWNYWGRGVPLNAGWSAARKSGWLCRDAKMTPLPENGDVHENAAPVIPPP